MIHKQGKVRSVSFFTWILGYINLSLQVIILLYSRNNEFSHNESQEVLVKVEQKMNQVIKVLALLLTSNKFSLEIKGPDGSSRD